MDLKVKHLEFVQGVINRLSTHSFLLKGWSVVIVTALLGLGAQSESTNLIYLALMPVLVLWGLDGYFLWQERSFRLLYDQVRLQTNEEVDFSMGLAPVLKLDKGWFSAVFSGTLVTFHGVLVLAIFAILIIEISQVWS